MQTPGTPEDLTPRGAERELESVLRGLRPRADSVDAAELAYRLGEAAGRQRVRRWQGATAGMALSGVVGMIAMSSTPAAEPSGLPIAAAPVVEASEPTAVLPVAIGPDPTGLRGVLRVSPYMRQRERALREGMEGLTMTPWDLVHVFEVAPVEIDRGERRQGTLELFFEAMKSGRAL